MKIFGKKSKNAVTTEEKTSEVEVKNDGEKREKKEDSILKIEKITKDIIMEPWITEKGHSAMTENKYVFRVHKDSKKGDVKKAVEAMYNVSVISVNIINIPPKKRNYGRYQGEKSGYKKAVVELKKGSKIELFKGV